MSDAGVEKVVVVTGAAGGLGWAIVEALADTYRAEFALIDQDGPALEARVAMLAERGVRARAWVADLSSEEEVAGVAGRLRAACERVDILVNNAGITHRSLACRTENAVIRRVMAVDYHAPVELAQGLLGQLRHAGGCVINVSSMAGWMPVLGRAGYCAAKSALHQYFETFREEVRGEGIHVLMVYPSFIATNIDRNALSGDGGRAQHKQSTIGAVRSAEWMAAKIVAAYRKGQERLFPHDMTLLGAYLYRLAPRLFMRQMVKNFRAELEAGKSIASGAP
ncbi:SDR family NAD(P)-dependent oxidoreductase [Microbulbifer sediminum]|uniref:SDR family NAD(P)-dependent oxidoreductase n=1 Tax=Microbulbifer sediminum TaxID=2904250 RepID=UPI001F2E59AF|nr:SDR family NAD(P)-dependent oxidoreductase [Microbulbifer sediminum]